MFLAAGRTTNLAINPRATMDETGQAQENVLIENATDQRRGIRKTTRKRTKPPLAVA